MAVIKKKKKKHHLVCSTRIRGKLEKLIAPNSRCRYSILRDYSNQRLFELYFSFNLFTDIQNCDSVKIKFETLHTMDSSDTIDIDSHMSDRASVSSKNAADSDNMMMITPELLGLMPSGSSVHSDSGENNSRGHSGQSSSHHHGSKSWTQEDMDAALEALRNHDMSLTKASGNSKARNIFFRSANILEPTVSLFSAFSYLIQWSRDHFSNVRYTFDDLVAKSASAWHRYSKKGWTY